MVDAKVTALDELTSVADSDILYIVDDPTGSPLSKKITRTNLFLAVSNAFTATQTFQDDSIQISNPADTFQYTIQTAAITADRILNIPLITADDTIATLGVVNVFTANQNLNGNSLLWTTSGITSIETSNQLVHTIIDDTSDAGVIIQNTDGSILIGNATGTTGEFVAQVRGTTNGSTQPFQIIAAIPVADDTGSSAVMVLDSRQLDNTALVTRPVLAIKNKGTLLWEIDASGNVDMQSNALNSVGSSDTIALLGSANVFTADQSIIKSNSSAVQIWEANHTTPADGQGIATLQFIDDNSVGTRKVYGQISSTIQVPTSGSEEGEMHFLVIDGGSGTDYIILNEAGDNDVSIKVDLAHQGTNLGFYSTAPISQQTGVAVTASAIHTALVALGLITA